MSVGQVIELDIVGEKKGRMLEGNVADSAQDATATTAREAKPAADPAPATETPAPATEPAPAAVTPAPAKEAAPAPATEAAPAAEPAPDAAAPADSSAAPSVDGVVAQEPTKDTGSAT